MRAFVACLLVASLIASSTSASIRKLEKRGLIGSHGNSHDEHGEVTIEPPNLGSSPEYLPPLPSVSVIKKQYPVPSLPTYDVRSYPSYSSSIPSSSYGVPALASSYNLALQVPSYTHSVSAQVPSYSVPVAAPLPSYSGHASAPSYSGSVSLPSTSYGVPSLPVYSAPVSSEPVVAPHPVSIGSSVHSGVGAGLASLPSISYGAPSVAVNAAPSAGVSFTSASYKVPTGYSSESGHSAGLSVSQFSVPSKSYGVPSPVVHGGGHDADYSGSVESVSSSHDVGSDASYDVHSSSVQLEQDNGYSYPVPSKQLII